MSGRVIHLPAPDHPVWSGHPALGDDEIDRMAGAEDHSRDDEIEQVAAEIPAPETIASVLTQWGTEGPLIHEPTGIARLDELTGGGPVYGSRWYVAGAPDAGKTALLIQLGHYWAERGVTVGFLAVDEEPSDLVARFAQRKGWRRTDTEARNAETLDAMSDALGALTIRFYDSSWTIESAAQDLRQAAGDGRAALLIDSIQTVQCEAERLAEREMSETAAVTARTRAVRAVATHHRLIGMATSEIGRAAYNSDEARRSVSTLAAGKWSGSIDYSARVLIGVRSVANEKDLIDLELAKNKHGPRDEHVYLKIDRASQSLWQTEYEAPPEEDRAMRRAERRDERVRATAASDAEVIRQIVASQPGITTRDLRGAFRARAGGGTGRCDAAVMACGDTIVTETGPRGSKRHHLAEGAE